MPGVAYWINDSTPPVAYKRHNITISDASKDTCHRTGKKVYMPPIILSYANGFSPVNAKDATACSFRCRKRSVSHLLMNVILYVYLSEFRGHRGSNPLYSLLMHTLFWKANTADAGPGAITFYFCQKHRQRLNHCQDGHRSQREGRKMELTKMQTPSYF